MVSEPSILSTVGNASENSITTQLDLQRWATEQHEWHERQMENLNLMLQKFGSSVTDLRQNQLCSEDSIEQTVSADFQKLASPSPKQQRRRVRRFPAQRPHRKIRAGKPTKRSGFPSKTARSSVRASRLPELGKLRVHVPLIGSQIRTHDLLIRCVNDVTSILGFCTDGNGDVDPGRPNHVWKPGGLLCVKAHRDGLRRVSSGGRVMKLVDSGFQVDPSEASNSKYGGLVYDIGKKKLGMEEAGAKMEMDAKKSKKLDCSLIALNPQGCFCWEGVGTRIIGDHCKCTSKENANRESLDHEDVGLRSDYKDFLLLNLTFTACVLKGAPEARLGARLTKAQPLSPSIAGARLCPKGSLERAPCHGASLSLRRASAEKLRLRYQRLTRLRA